MMAIDWRWPDLWPNWESESWTAIGTLALAAVTVITLFVQEPLRRRYGRAVLEMSIRSHPPDVHSIEMRVHDAEGSVIHSEMVMYIRVLVTHIRGRTGENVELLAARVWRMADDGIPHPVTKFLPMPLLWSSAGGSTTMRVPAGVFRHCDLGYLGRMPDEPVKFFMSTVVQPFGVGNNAELPSVLSHGTYELDIVLSGDNVRPIQQTWRISFGPEWTDDEHVMIASIDIAPVV